MNNFNNMYSQFGQGQLTPQQQTELHKQQMYKEYCQSERGIQMNKLATEDFNEWYEQKFNINQNANNNSDLLKIIEEQNKKIDLLMKNMNGGVNNR